MDAFREPNSALLYAFRMVNDEENDVESKVSNVVLSISDFIVNKETFIRNGSTVNIDFSKFIRLKRFSDYILRKADSLDYSPNDLNVSIVIGKDFTSTVQRTNEMRRALIIVNMLRNAIVHGCYTIDAENETIKIDWSSPGGDRRLKIDLPTSVLDNAFYFGQSDSNLIDNFVYIFEDLMNKSHNEIMQVFDSIAVEDDPTFMRRIEDLFDEIKNDPNKIHDEKSIKTIVMFLYSNKITRDTKEAVYERFMNLYKQSVYGFKTSNKLEHIDVSSRSNRTHNGKKFALLYNYLCLFFTQYDTRSNEFEFIASFSDFSKATFVELPDDLKRRKTNFYGDASINLQGAMDRIIDTRENIYQLIISGVKNDMTLEEFEQENRQICFDFITKNTDFNWNYFRMMRNAVEHFNVSYEGDYICFKDYSGSGNLIFDMKIKMDDLLFLLNRSFVNIYQTSIVNEDHQLSYDELDSHHFADVYEKMNERITTGSRQQLFDIPHF